MGAFEAGAKRMMNNIVEVTVAGVISVISGGDTATACKKYKTVDQASHGSTGGGSSLEHPKGKVRPGVAALDDASVMEENAEYCLLGKSCPAARPHARPSRADSWRGRSGGLLHCAMRRPPPPRPRAAGRRTPS
jgi:hypothetical protein